MSILNADCFFTLKQNAENKAQENANARLPEGECVKAEEGSEARPSRILRFLERRESQQGPRATTNASRSHLKQALLAKAAEERDKRVIIQMVQFARRIQRAQGERREA